VQLITLSDSDLQDQVTKLTKKYSNDVSSDLYRLLLAFRACASAFIQKAKDPQDVDSSRERGKQRTQLLKAQAAERQFASSYISG